MALRDYLWNYPDYISRVYKAIAPLSYILLFIPLTLGLIWVIDIDSLISKYSNENDTLSEGTVGYLSNINPLFLPLTQVDRDLRSLVYSPLLEYDLAGQPKGVVAKDWKISSDGRTYTFYINDSFRFADGEVLDADDVISTMEYAKGVYSSGGIDSIGQQFVDLDIKKLDRFSFQVVLPRKSASFLESMSFYILPQHVLKDISYSQIYESEYSKKPFGSGPYFVMDNQSSKVILSENIYGNRELKFSEIEYNIYSTDSDLEAAFRNGHLDVITSSSSKSISFVNEYVDFDKYEVLVPYRKKMIFFNTRVSLLSSEDVRKGVAKLIDNDSLVSKASIDGRSANGPYPTTSWAFSQDSSNTNGYNPTLALEDLKAGGYTKSGKYFVGSDGKILSLRLTYLDSEINNRIANSLRELLDNEGVIIDLDPKDYISMTRETLATRDYDLLLYEVETTADPDQYDLWHSSRVDFPNLNLSGIKSERIDLFIERGRNYDTISERKEAYQLFQRVLALECPVKFLYNSKYIVVTKNGIGEFNNISLSSPEDRYESIIY